MLPAKKIKITNLVKQHGYTGFEVKRLRGERTGAPDFVKTFKKNPIV